MIARAPISIPSLRSLYRRWSRPAKVVSSAAAAITVAGFLISAINFTGGTSFFHNPSERYRSDLSKIAQQHIIDPSYALLAKPGVTPRLLLIPKIEQRRASMEAIFTKHINENNLEGKLEQTVNIYDRIIECRSSWFCHIDDYEYFKDQIINVWFSYAGKIRKMRGAVTRSDFGVLLEQEAQRLRIEQKAKVG